MDPWMTCQTNVTVQEIPITKFEDNFTPTINDKLPDSEQYLAVLEEKLKKIKNDPRLLAQLTAKKEACMQQLLNSAIHLDEEIIELEESIPHSQILRTIAPQKQALNQGEIVELVKYDQLKDDESDTEINKDCIENRSP
ncbi:hypothetical protein NQ314_008773 [Rhamnusium bicolor]|uniref:Uncharacterized protein n=1 Tax=Rhamnusium bicolor TaxID=1586634 RepID=A0AAV8Y918_9CUCU|nr:hypothetical protein NQ314_008773 [Rhamnusium bicolor]